MPNIMVGNVSPPEPTPPEPTPCWDEVETMRKIHSPWTYKCTHRGGYKPIQCNANGDGNVECWCSTKFGHESGGIKVYDCRQPESL